jgi:metal-dependent amidase/aminoacylase/carboxypeptidase family protein
MWNDPAVAQVLQEVAAQYVGEENTIVGKPGMYGEDFSYM